LNLLCSQHLGGASSPFACTNSVQPEYVQGPVVVHSPSAAAGVAARTNSTAATAHAVPCRCIVWCSEMSSCMPLRSRPASADSLGAMSNQDQQTPVAGALWGDPGAAESAVPNPQWRLRCRDWQGLEPTVLPLGGRRERPVRVPIFVPKCWILGGGHKSRFATPKTWGHNGIFVPLGQHHLKLNERLYWISLPGTSRSNRTVATR
jgi:hypothetical protein